MLRTGTLCFVHVSVGTVLRSYCLSLIHALWVLFEQYMLQCMSLGGIRSFFWTTKELLALKVCIRTCDVSSCAQLKRAVISKSGSSAAYLK